MALRVTTAPIAAHDLALEVGGVPVRLVVRPVSTLLLEQAEWAARLATQAAEREKGSRLDEAERLGCYFATYVAQLGRAAIQSWDVVDGDGAPVPCAPDVIATVLMLNPDLSKEFDRRYSAAIAARRAEGNAFAPAPSGTSAAGATTAATAVPTTTIGTASAAPT